MTGVCSETFAQSCGSLFVKYQSLEVIAAAFSHLRRMIQMLLCLLINDQCRIARRICCFTRLCKSMPVRPLVCDGLHHGLEGVVEGQQLDLTRTVKYKVMIFCKEDSTSIFFPHMGVTVWT